MNELSGTSLHISEMERASNMFEILMRHMGFWDMLEMMQMLLYSFQFWTLD
jgi:hypothetical protein